MNPRAFLLLILPFLLIQGSSRASAETEAAEQRLKTSVDAVITVAKQAPDRKALQTGVKPILEKILSFDAMTRRAVGPGWREFTPEQQRETVALFTSLIIRTYTAKFTPGELPSITYKTATIPAPNRVEIPTVVLYKGSHYDVVYRLEQAANDWLITDVVIEGVSMIANYRTQFDPQFKQGGAPAVIKALKSSVDSPN